MNIVALPDLPFRVNWRSPARLLPRGGTRWSLAILTLAVGVLRSAGAADGVAEEAEDDVMISLPPLLVEERLAPLRWRYLAAPGLELLSLWDDPATREFARRCHRLDQVLRLLVPPQFQGRSSVPDLQILFNEDLTRAKSQEIMQEMLRREKVPLPSSGSVTLPLGGAPRNGPLATWQRRQVYFMPNLRLSDIDATAVFVATQGSGEGLTEFTYVADRVRFLLERRVPALPDWFVAGTVGLYERAQLQPDGIAIAPSIWLSETETRALEEEEDRPRTLWPLHELLAAHRPPPGDEAGERARLWRAQCALFVRWAVVENDGARKEALWTFVDRLERETLNEALFRECFGLGFSDVRDRLSDFLPAAVARGATLRAPKLVAPPEFHLRAATDVEIARLRGEWERMQINYVKRWFPALTAKYVDQARNTLQLAYGRGERDPQLLAVIGLTEFDAGNSPGARAYLETAARAGIVRPRIYVELARLRLAEVVAEAGEGNLNAAQVERVLDPLRVLRGMEPPLFEGYAILANIWSRSDVAPTPEDLAWLNAGVVKFARISPLVLRAIYLNVTNGFVAPAIALARAGECAAVDEETRQKFSQVLAKLTTATETE